MSIENKGQIKESKSQVAWFPKVYSQEICLRAPFAKVNSREMQKFLPSKKFRLGELNSDYYKIFIRKSCEVIGFKTVDEKLGK